MAHRDSFWKFQHLSDAQLLQSLGTVLRTQRQTLAELVAHLGEVEDRRLHLQAAHSSMFSYCVAQLRMSEDEACRRIELARLARTFPALFAELASGRITLSVALVLKPVLSASNHLELLSAARGRSIRQARELVAERFPQPDAPSSIRKLPEQRSIRASEPVRGDSPARSSAASLPLLEATTVARPPSVVELPAAPPPAPSQALHSPPVPTTAEPKLAPDALPSERPGPTPSSPPVEGQPASSPPRGSSAPPRSRSCIDPLSAQRYRIQFTADAGLKQKLELARDLLRHAHPSGDFAAIVARALDLLLADLLRRRLGAGARRKAPSPASPKASTTPSPALDPDACPANPSANVASTTAHTSRAPIPRAARRAVLERDGLGCSWTGPHGERCGSQAWLELDHRHPAGKDGSSEPENLRLLCRAHNRLAAEQAYGREHIERMSTHRERACSSPP